MEKKLKLSSKNKIIGGVCGGVAEYFNADPTLIRVLYVILGFISSGIPLVILYIICWAIMPQDKDN